MISEELRRQVEKVFEKIKERDRERFCWMIDWLEEEIPGDPGNATKQPALKQLVSELLPDGYQVSSWLGEFEEAHMVIWPTFSREQMKRQVEQYFRNNESVPSEQLQAALDDFFSGGAAEQEAQIRWLTGAHQQAAIEHSFLEFVGPIYERLALTYEVMNERVAYWRPESAERQALLSEYGGLLLSCEGQIEKLSEAERKRLVEVKALLERLDKSLTEKSRTTLKKGRVNVEILSTTTGRPSGSKNKTDAAQRKKNAKRKQMLDQTIFRLAHQGGLKPEQIKQGLVASQLSVPGRDGAQRTGITTAALRGWLQKIGWGQGWASYVRSSLRERGKKNL